MGEPSLRVLLFCVRAAAVAVVAVVVVVVLDHVFGVLDNQLATHTQVK
jgi:hypothetical protein